MYLELLLQLPLKVTFEALPIYIKVIVFAFIIMIWI